MNRATDQNVQMVSLLKDLSQRVGDIDRQNIAVLLDTVRLVRQLTTKSN